MSGAARADVLDGVLEVRSAYVKPEQGVFQLFARVTYPVNDDIRAAHRQSNRLRIAYVADPNIDRGWQQRFGGLAGEDPNRIARRLARLDDARANGPGRTGNEGDAVSHAG